MVRSGSWADKGNASCADECLSWPELRRNASVSDSRSGEAAVDHERVPGMDIAVIGMSCIFPGADEPDAFWRNIVTGVESLTDLSEEDLRGAGEDPELIRTPEYVRRAACIDNVDLFDAEF